ncbi:MAG: DUF2062 domain-containing protein [Nevskia sp.]|nr:DUF2062 domain-containing protein [Nevskia sp.]
MSAALPPAAAGGFWRRRVLGLLLAQLRQGTSADQIALTLALGGMLSIFPILGATTLLCGAVALWLRLNQPVMQLVNWLCAPLQLALLIPFYRAGEALGAPHLALSIPQLMQRFGAGPLKFLADFAAIALGGIGVWCLAAPLAGGLLYLALRAPLRLLALRTRRAQAAT